MNLKKYLFENQITQKQLAQELGYTRQYINYVINGRNKMGKKLAKAIAIFTHNKVSTTELLEKRGNQPKNDKDHADNKRNYNGEETGIPHENSEVA